MTFLQNTSGYRRDLRRVEYGDERDPKMRAFLEKTAPLTNAEKIQKPLFVVQGVQRSARAAHPSPSRWSQRIRSVGTPVWYLMAKDEGHGFAKKSNRDSSSTRPILFMKQFLLDKQ